MKKGDRVSIYMPMVVELVVAMLACVRIGAVHSIVVSCRHPSTRWFELKMEANAGLLLSVCRFLCRVSV